MFYFMFISAFFSMLAKVLECYDVSSSSFLTKRFLLVSGLGQAMEQSDTCLWVEGFARTLVGRCVLVSPIIRSHTREIA